MAARSLMLPASRAFNTNGVPVAHAVAKLYLSGGVVPQNFYSDASLVTSLGSSITANSIGRFPVSYQNSATAFRLIIDDASGAQLDDIDPFYFGQSALTAASTIFDAGLFVDIATLEIPANTLFIQTRGYSASDVGSAVYVHDAAVDAAYVTAHPRSSFISLNGRGFRLSLEQDITPQMFGALGGYPVDDPLAALLANAFATGTSASGYSVGGGLINVPKSLPYYIGSAVDIYSTIKMVGEGPGDAGGWPSAFRLAANITGFRVQRYNTTGDTGTDGTAFGTRGGDASILSGIAVVGAYDAATAPDGDYPLIRARARFAVRDCSFWKSQDAAIKIHAGSALPESGNANNWEVTSAWIENCRFGLHVTGADANQGIAKGVKISGARQWGIYDEAANIYIAPLTQLCGFSGGDGMTVAKAVSAVEKSGRLFAVRAGQEVAASTASPPASAIDDANWYYFGTGSPAPGQPTWFSGINLRAGGSYRLVNGGLMLGGYHEGGQPPAQMGGSALVVGGNWPQLPKGGGYINAAVNQVIINDLRVFAGGVGFDDDHAGVLKVGRYSAANAVSLIFPSALSNYLILCSPDQGQKVFVGNAEVDVFSNLGLDVGHVFKIDGTQVVGARQTGWTAATGTPARGTFAAAAAGTASAGYVQAEAQGALTRIAALEARLIALEADARTHGLIN